MISHQDSERVTDICAKVKHLGFSVSKQVKLYGEEYEIVSDPFVEGDGVAIHVKSRRNPVVRILRLPSTVLKAVLRPRSETAA